MDDSFHEREALQLATARPLSQSKAERGARMASATDDIFAVEATLLGALDSFIDQRDEPPNPRMTRQEAVNVILADWLVAQGFLPLRDESEPVVNALDAARVP